MASPLLDDPRLTAVGLFMEAHLGLSAKLAPRFAAYGLSETEYEVLLRLARTPGGRLRMSDLSAQTSLSTSGITRVVDRLERDGLTSRESCETDRRGTWAQISDAGMERVVSVLGPHLDDVEKWFTGRLTADQLAALTDALRVIRDAVHPNAVAGVRETDQPAAIR
ncbi:MAG TPA: MarR family transcriptional regulator [Jiangellaceae bacterium]|nr:MarR family transcriptional regulator [Jiangellaceae bacterium]